MKKLRERDKDLLEACYGRSAGVREVARARGRSAQSIHNSLRRIRRALFECVRRSHGARGSGMSGDGRGELPAEFLDLVDDLLLGAHRRIRGPPARGPLARERRGASPFRRVFPPSHRDPFRGPRRAGGRGGAGAARISRARVPGGRDDGDSGRSRRPWPVPRPWMGLAALLATAAAVVLWLGLGAESAAYACRRPPGSRPVRTSPGWSTPRTAGGTTRRSGRAGTCAPARTCTWSGGWPRSSSTAALGSSSRDRRASRLVSGRSVQLLKGTLTARVPDRARGFTVLTPHNKVVDLGTEFGLSVDDQGAATVRVFTGEVVAYPLVPDRAADPGVTIRQDQAARLDGRDGRPRAARAREERREVRASHRAPADRHAPDAPPGLLAPRPGDDSRLSRVAGSA